VPLSKPTKCQTTDLRGKERAEQRITAAGAKVREAEVDERQFFSLTHCSKTDVAAAGYFRFSVVCRWQVLRDGECRTD